MKPSFYAAQGGTQGVQNVKEDTGHNFPVGVPSGKQGERNLAFLEEIGQYWIPRLLSWLPRISTLPMDTQAEQQTVGEPHFPLHDPRCAQGEVRG